MPETEQPLSPQGITFYGDEIIAILEPTTQHVYVPLARLCANLGIDPPSQMQRIQAHEVLSTALATLSIQSTGGPQATLCLRLDLIPFWLAGINTQRVRADVREKLVRYQRECAAVLWDFFRPPGQPSSAALDRATPTAPVSPAAQAYELALAVAALARQQMHIEDRLHQFATQLETQAARTEALELRLTAPEPQLRASTISEEQAAELAQAVKFVARALGERTGRNEYGGVYGQLYREFGITSYKQLPREQFAPAMEWLRDWYRTIQQERGPEPDTGV
ncbi:MAG: hypothetical protein HC911_17680 [Chloroflexaceae bacterium]|nr:hypothetical protein [Chloroflexaceae bacterium]